MPVTISGTAGIQTPGIANSGTNTAALFSGPLVGNVTGNVTGNVNSSTITTASLTASNLIEAYPTFVGSLSTGWAASDTADITWNVVYANVGNCYSVPTGRFTAPVKGIYSVYATCLPPQATAGDFRIFLYKNNISTFGSLVTKVANIWQQLTIDRLVSLEQNDYISLRYQLGGGTLHSDALYNHIYINLVKQLP